MAPEIQYTVLTAFEFEEVGTQEWKITKYIGFDEEYIEIPSQIGDKRIVALGDNQKYKVEQRIENDRRRCV